MLFRLGMNWNRLAPLCTSNAGSHWWRQPMRANGDGQSEADLKYSHIVSFKENVGQKCIKFYFILFIIKKWIVHLKPFLFGSNHHNCPSSSSSDPPPSPAPGIVEASVHFRLSSSNFSSPAIANSACKMCRSNSVICRPISSSWLLHAAKGVGLKFGKLRYENYFHY